MVIHLERASMLIDSGCTSYILVLSKKELLGYVELRDERAMYALFELEAFGAICVYLITLN